MISAKVDFALLFPALPSNDSAGGPHGTGQLIVERRQQSPAVLSLEGKPLEREHDKSVAREQR